MSLFPPGHTRGLTGAAEAFCLLHCREPDDTCPYGLSRAQCPLWVFVADDLPTTLDPDFIGEPEDSRARTCRWEARGPRGVLTGTQRISLGRFDPEEGWEWPARRQRPVEPR